MWDAWCARCHAQDGSGKIAEPTVTVEPMDFTDCKVTTPSPTRTGSAPSRKAVPASACHRKCPAFEDSLTAEQIGGFVAHIRGFCKETRMAERQHQLSPADHHREGVSGK